MMRVHDVLSSVPKLISTFITLAIATAGGVTDRAGGVLASRDGTIWVANDGSLDHIVNGAISPFVLGVVFQVTKSLLCWKIAPGTCGWEWMTNCISSKVGASVRVRHDTHDRAIEGLGFNQICSD
jgi:hypothetical protein